MIVNPLLSLITVTAFDHVRLLQTLKNMKNLGKDYEHLFVIPSNDQDSLNIINKYQGETDALVSINFDNKSGIYPAMNLGAVNAKGRYILFINSGDEISNINVIRENTNRVGEIDPVWAILGVSLPWNEQYFAYEGMERDFRLQKRNGYVSHQSVIVRSTIFKEIGLFDTRFPIAADTKCIFQLGLIAKPLILDDIAVKVEKGFNVTSHNRESRIEVFRLINSIGSGFDRITSNYYFILRELKFASRKLIRYLRF